jgi:hypothetical protein
VAGSPVFRAAADRILIPTTDPDKWLELSNAEPKGVATPVDSYVVTIQLRELRASTRPLNAYNELGGDGSALAAVLAQMATEWRGWKGEKVWHTTDHEVTLTFTHDRVSRVRVDVELKDSPAGNWKVEGEIAVELGNLDRIAKDVAEYLRV